MKFNKSLFLIFFLVSIQAVLPQNYIEYSFTVKDGLISDLTKSIIQDAKGFIWIATDEGISRFDGVRFSDYTPEVRNRYFKDFHVTRDGRLLALYDLGLIEIKNNTFNVKYLDIAYGSAADQDTSIHYGKSIYEDQRGEIWVSEGKAVLRISKEGKKKYRFSAEDHSFSFLRSFQFFEDKNNNLYVISFAGNIYKFNSNTDTFQKVKTDYTPNSVNAVLKISPDEFLTGSASGLSLIKIKKDGSVSHSAIPENLTEVSTLDIRNGLIIAGTWNNGLYISDFRNGKFNFLKPDINEEKKVNKLIFDKEGQIWAATERGISLLARQDFQLISTIRGNNFVQSIKNTDRNSDLIVHGSAVFEVMHSDGSVKRLFESRNSNIMAAGLKEELLYIADDLSRLSVIEGNTIRQVVPLLTDGTIPSSMLIDNDGNIWILFYNSSKILRFDKQLKPSVFTASENTENSPDKIYQDDEGYIYISGFRKNAILRKFDPSSGKFNPVNSGSDNSPLRIYDFEKYQNNWYIASDSGIFKLSGSELTEMLKSEFEKVNITAIEFDPNGSVWVGSNKGLFRIENEKQVLEFDESNGLPARTINPGAIIISGTGIIAGTPNGAVRFTGSSLSLTTKKPFVTLSHHHTGDVLIPVDNEISILEGESLNLSAISTSYPNKNIIYEIVINGEGIVERKFFNGYTEFGFKLPAGSYQVYIRAKKNGNFNWSESFVFTLNIKGWWYTSWWALLLYILAALGLIYAGSYIISLKVRRENQKLESIVKARTEEIRHKNEILEIQNSKIEKQYSELQILLKQLEESNFTKNKLFSVISHDLKNPFVALLGISELLLDDFDDLDDEEKKEFIKKINNSGRVTFALVENLLNWARSQTNRIIINSSYYNLKSLYDDEISVLNNLAAEKNLKIINNISGEIIVYADRHMMSSVARNILQNAIKYSPLSGRINISSKTDAYFASVSITDEGAGMTAEQISGLFTLEKKIVTMGTLNEKGTGLGLLVCREFTEANGGEIMVESAPGEGSTFTVSLPLKKSEE